jgi:hypothetical protein
MVENVMVVDTLGALVRHEFMLRLKFHSDFKFDSSITFSGGGANRKALCEID